MEALFIIGTVFLIIFLAEIGDKTQIVAITLSARYHWLPVFWGVLLGMGVVTAVGIIFGVVIFQFIPIFWVRFAAGIAFIIFGIWTLVEKEEDEDEDEIEEGLLENGGPEQSTARSSNKSSGKVFNKTFGLIVLAEFGDKTQLAAITLTATYGAPLEVFIGSMCGFAAITAIGIIIGLKFLRKVPEKWVKLGSAVLFIAFGILFLLELFTPLTLL